MTPETPSSRTRAMRKPDCSPDSSPADRPGRASVAREGRESLAKRVRQLVEDEGWSRADAMRLAKEGF